DRQGSTAQRRPGVRDLRRKGMTPGNRGRGRDMNRTTVLTLIAIATALAGREAAAGSALDAIRSRGQLVCGVRVDTIGFAHQEDSGRYSGLEVDMCRIVAAAIFANADKVKYIPLPPDKRIPAIQAGDVDMLASGTTYTMTRGV